MEVLIYACDAFGNMSILLPFVITTTITLKIIETRDNIVI